MTSQTKRAHTLRELHHAPEILRLVNVWDAITAKVVAADAHTRAIATAGHSIAASHGYEDGQHIPFDLLLSAIERIVNATSLPVTADLDAGFGGDPEDMKLVRENARRVVAAGVVGLNVEDRMDPLPTSLARMEAVLAGANDEGIDLVLNARTDAVVRSTTEDFEHALDHAVERGLTYLDAGATAVFVPGVLDQAATRTLVSGLGSGKLSVIGLPGALSAPEYEALGVGRISYGPMTQNLALTELKYLASSLYHDGVIPTETEMLNG